jgi:hypothetical protein
VSAAGGLRDGIEGQVRGFGERLDGGIKLIDERAAGIAIKLNGDMAQMRSEANTSREALRGLVEAKLDWHCERSRFPPAGLGGSLCGQ